LLRSPMALLISGPTPNPTSPVNVGHTYSVALLVRVFYEFRGPNDTLEFIPENRHASGEWRALVLFEPSVVWHNVMEHSQTSRPQKRCVHFEIPFDTGVGVIPIDKQKIH